MTDAHLPEAIPAAPARVLVIDDEPQIRKFLDISLSSEGYRVVTAESGHAGLAALATQGADLVVLDLGLPDIDGHEVLTQLRQWSQVPVIVLTVRPDEGEKARALDAGANDYVTKPVGIQELMARIRAVRRALSAPTDGPPVFDDGHLRVDLAMREVRLDSKPVVLARKEYALLALLIQQGGRVVTQLQVLRELWGPDHQVETHQLRVLVGKLRQQLDDDATKPRYIATEPGVGLRFVGWN